jgi:alcohol dehydrogenase class IV
MMGFGLSPRLCWGPGAIEQLSGLGARRVLIIADPGLLRTSRHRRILEEFQGMEAVVEAEATDPGEPTAQGVSRVAQRAREVTPDWIVALGGGSTIDTAKGAWVAYEHPEMSLTDPPPVLELGLRSRARFVAVPTTSGSGSDASWLARWRLPDGRAIELASRELVPDWVLLDPAFPATLPPALTAACGAESIAHALEAWTSPWANPFSDAFARDALARLGRDLPKVFRHGDDLEARFSVHFAATHAGIAGSNSQLGLAHALAGALGGAVDRPYGALLAAVLPYVVEFNFPAIRERLTLLDAPLVIGGAQSRTVLSDRIRSLWTTLGLPRSLEEAGAPAERLAPRLEAILGWTLRSSAAVANPRIASADELRALLDSAGRGLPVTF